MGFPESFGGFLNFPLGRVATEVNRGANARRAHLIGLFGGTEVKLGGLVGVGQQFVVVQLYDEGNFVGVFTGRHAQDSQGGSYGVTAALNGQLHNIFSVEINRVLGEGSTRAMLDALVHGKNGNVAGAGQAAGGIKPLEVVQNPLIAVCRGENAIDPIRARDMKGVLGNSLAFVAQEILGVFAQMLFEIG